MKLSHLLLYVVYMCKKGKNRKILYIHYFVTRKI